MTQPLVSFIVPIYNAEKTVERCVRSLQEQTISDLEILLIDDGSKDCSLEVCCSMADKDSRIRVIHQENAGVSVARNVGIENALGKYISFVDADDWIDANVCEVFSNYLKMYDYDLFCFSAVYHMGDKQTLFKLFAHDIPLLSDAQREELHLKVMTPWAPDFEYNVKKRFSASASGKFYRRSIIEKENVLFKPGCVISEDCLFNVLALEHMKVVGYSSQCNYYYEQHLDSAQNRYRPNSLYYFYEIALEISKWLKICQKKQRFIDSANVLYVHFIFGSLREDYFHLDNKHLFSKKIADLRNDIENDFFSNALVHAKYEYFSFAEKILLFLLKKKNIKTISILLSLYNRLH